MIDVQLNQQSASSWAWFNFYAQERRRRRRRPGGSSTPGGPAAPVVYEEWTNPEDSDNAWINPDTGEPWLNPE